MEPIDQVLVAPTRDLGDGFQVRRALPSARRRMVGPFIFFDQMGPALLTPGHGLDVRPHPHIGLATVTYLFEGEILHRDSLGTVQPIRPGEVNWMVAGKGIVHSERTPPEVRLHESRVFGIQIWVALPKTHEEMEPQFAHHAADELPKLDGDGAKVTLIAGTLFGKRAPTNALSDLFYADVRLEAGARFQLTAEHEERAVYVAIGTLDVEGDETRHGPGELLILKPRTEVVVHAAGPARLMLLGGAPADGPRRIFWNFVHSSQERIEEAKRDWREGRFPKVPGETEFIPLPDDTPPPVRYP